MSIALANYAVNAPFTIRLMLYIPHGNRMNEQIVNRFLPMQECGGSTA